jgi:tripartite-type tricarboxylate transporter receptor subunit TctC
MKSPRRNFLHLAVGAAALPAVSRIARAQAYPTRPVRLIVAYPPGGGTDGYTLLVVDNAPALNATIYDKLTFNFIRDIAPVASIARQPTVMVVHPSVQAKIAYAKANPGKLNMAVQSIGNLGHVAGELFKMITGVNMVDVPYRGQAPALTDPLGGQAQVMFAGLFTANEYIRSGRLRALAVTSATRSNALPDIPSLSEFLPGYEGAPKDTPAEIIAKLNQGDQRCTRRSEDKGAALRFGWHTPSRFACRLRKVHCHRN